MATPVDWEKALQNADGSDELLLELIELFNDERPEMMRQIRAAIDQRDPPALRRTAHNLKGSARIFAAGGAVEAAQRLEDMGAEGDLSGADACWAELGQEVERLTAALAEKISRQET